MTSAYKSLIIHPSLFESKLAILKTLVSNKPGTKQTGNQESFALDIAFGNSTITGCDISSKGLACISLHGTASPVIKANRVHSGTETGIMITGQSQAIIDGNMIFGNEFAGIEIRDEANPQINNNHIYDENEVGILIHKYGSRKIANSSIFSNRFSGVEIRSRANPLITNNRIYHKGRSGIFPHAFAAGLIEGTLYLGWY